jgi:hypothetical protein
MYIIHLKPDQPEALPKRINAGEWVTSETLSQRRHQL